MIIYHGSIFHITWQCHDNKPLLRDRWCKKLYYDLLLAYKDKYDVKIFSYNFMDTHPHFTGQMEDPVKFSRFMLVVNCRYATIFNKNHKRRGQVVMDRFKSIVIESEESLFRVMSYIDMNAVRAGIVSHPKDWEFSSFHYYAYGRKDPLIDPPLCYLNLSNDPQRRCAMYLAMIEGVLRSEGYKTDEKMQRLFVGNPIWVFEKYRAIKKFMREKRAVYMANRTKPPSIKISFN
jgi:putative transposase